MKKKMILISCLMFLNIQALAENKKVNRKIASANFGCAQNEKQAMEILKNTGGCVLGRFKYLCNTKDWFEYVSRNLNGVVFMKAPKGKKVFVNGNYVDPALIGRGEYQYTLQETGENSYHLEGNPSYSTFVIPAKTICFLDLIN